MFNCQPLTAQTPNIQPIPPPTRPLPELPKPLPLQPEILTPSPPPPVVEEIPTNTSGTITIKQFRFQGNTVFSDEELAEITQSYLNRPITFAELLEARSTITQRYIDEGYTTSGAFIPLQRSQDGIVTIEIVEGTLGEINITMTGKLRSGYVRERLALATDGPLNVPRLLEALQLLQVNPRIQTISAELSATPEPGVSILNVTAISNRSFYPASVLDNGRNPQVGSFRRGADLSDINLLGFGDSLFASYRNSDGSDDVEVSYAFPVNARNGTIKASYRTLTSEITEAPLSELDVISNYEKYSFSFRQPVIETLSEEFVLGITLDHQKSQSRYLGGLPFPTRGADDEGKTNVTTLRFTQEYINRSEEQVIALRSEFSLGIDALGATDPFDILVNPQAPKTPYFFWRGEAQWLKVFAPDSLFISRVNLQVADSPIVSNEQFALGGLGSVKGYRSNTLLTDNGVFATMELRLPVLRIPENQIVIQLVPFTDFGYGWNMGEVPSVPIETLASVGLGIQFQYGRYINARLDYAERLGNVPYQLGNTWQDRGWLFTFTLTP
ncbi:MAG: ShlB/FhaC/HecB family hemolysin secretion/activation protein [Crocosphaera sp.]|nr:ShlB/FhaC/HecB family hemolysin secretion/activation protein [Crocosphaera sp.]